MRHDRITPVPPSLGFGQFALRSLRWEDFEPWFGYIADPEVMRFGSYDIESVQDGRRLFEWYLNGYQRKYNMIWAVARQRDNVLIGTCGFISWDLAHSVAELWFDLCPHFWNQDISTQAVHVVLRHGFEHLRFSRVQATVMVDNAAACRVLEKMGFQREGLMREYKLCRGQRRDFWRYAMLGREWLEDECDARLADAGDSRLTMADSVEEVPAVP